MKCVLQEIVNDINYFDISYWHLPNLASFSENKTLFDYQVRAIQNITKVLYLYYSECNANKNNLFQKYKEYGLNDKKFDIENMTKRKENKQKV